MKNLKNNNIYSCLLAFILVVAISGCDSPNNTPGQYTNGVFVVNEGSFGNSNGELSFIKSDNSINNNLYSASNGGLQLGDVLQSMMIVNSDAYLVVNNSNKIEVVDINNLQNKASIHGFSMPRYMVNYNGKGYVSEYVSFSGNGKLKVIDLATKTVIDSITVGIQPEHLWVVGDKILVANSGDTTLHLVSTANLSVTNIGDIDYPRYITKTNDGNIWVLYTGKPGWSGTNTSGGLLVLNSTATTIVKNIIIGSTPTQNPSQLTTDGNNLFYEYQGNVYKIDKAATVAPASPFINAPATSLYGMDYYAASNTLFIADAKNFTTSGVVRRFNASTGAMIDTLNAGVAPNSFIFN